MSTIIGLETDDGAILAGDRRHVADDTAVSEGVRRVFAFESAAVGAAAVGAPGAIETFASRLEAETRRDRIERDAPLGIDRLAGTAAPIAESAGVDAIVAARDASSVARIRAIGRDGGVLSDTYVAFGTGAQIALGHLEGIDALGDVERARDRLEDLFATISERDPETGDGVDVWTLTDDPTD